VSFNTLDAYAPARPRSLAITRIAARFAFGFSVVSTCSMLENVARADTARVSSRAYGAAAAAACWALMMRDAAINSIARVIFLVDWVDLIFARYSRSETAIVSLASAGRSAPARPLRQEGRRTPPGRP